MQFLFFLICFGASIIGAICGIGGGVIIKPIMDVVGDFSVHTIGVIASIAVFTMAFVSILKQTKSKTKIPFGTAIPLSIGSVIGGISGERFFSFIVNLLRADGVVKIVQNIVLTVLILWVFIYMNNKNKFKRREFKGVVPELLTGLFLGMSSAFLGIGGGPINVSVITFVFSLPIKTATICSLMTILFSQFSKLITIYFTKGFSDLDFAVVMVMVFAAIIGGFLGAQLNKNLSEKTVSKAFNFLLIIVLCLTIFNIFNNMTLKILQN